MSARTGRPAACALFAACLPAVLWLFLTAHSPYRQWQVYRQKHLLILTSRTDPAGQELGRRVARVLADHLPASAARTTRAPGLGRVSSLLATGQLDVALLPRRAAAELARGLPLRTLVGLDRHLLVCREDFPLRHAYLVAKTLSTHGEELAGDSRAPLAPDSEAVIPVHPGAAAYLRGDPEPQAGPMSPAGSGSAARPPR